jgi:PII-like signaling protein
MKEKIEAFLTVLDSLVDEGLVTVEPARIILYRASQHARG